MIVGTRPKLSKLLSPPPFLIHDKPLKYVKQYNYLGVVLDNELSMIPMYKNLEKRLVDKVYMLRKLRKYLTYNAAVQIYKQTILPILDYPGFIILACNRDKKSDLQIIQNDVLRFCENKCVRDKIPIEQLHKTANLVSLEQRRVNQLLVIMYKISRNPVNIVVPNRQTRQHQKLVFRIDSKIGTKYANSPYYKGVKLWDQLTREEQDIDNIHDFKACITKKNKTFVKNYYV